MTGGGVGDGGGVGETDGESAVCSTRFRSSREWFNLAPKSLIDTLVPSLRDLITARRTRLACAMGNAVISTPQDLSLADGMITSHH